MLNIPALAESDLGDTIEGEFGVPVTLTSPGGVEITLRGFVRRSYRDTREKSGDTVIVNAPVVKLRLSSLPELPATGEKWIIGIPENPLDGAGMELYDLDPKKPVEVNRSKGTVKLFLAKMRNAE